MRIARPRSKEAEQGRRLPPASSRRPDPGDARGAPPVAAATAGGQTGGAGADRHESGPRLHDPQRPVHRAAESLPVVPADLGVGRLPQIRPHDTRDGCASLLFAADVAPRTVTEILGHSRIAVTMNVYTRERRRPP
ncbi:tyrosine-type recombinase/integrase [Streptomyces sp. NPDC006458]|uniref:tyrosine-type recombinase/integrase n=1 Tax=Streptomyces sp. NPDC006458 TaxID=3154302 RepID=UPI0033A74FAB